MQKHDFDPDFDQAFSSKRMNDFEDWFCEMSENVWGTDFERIKAGGKYGDKKSDGRLVSAEHVFQCYAPDSPATFAANAPGKIQDSFPEVTQFWPGIKQWTFVHNNQGLTTKVSDTLEALREAFPKIIIRTGARTFLKSELHDKLQMTQLVTLYPSAAVLRFQLVKMEHIGPLLKNILENATAVPNPSEFGLIPNEDKLDCNKLSDFAKRDLRHALTQADLVRRFLNSANFPHKNALIQSEIRQKYVELKALGYVSDDLLTSMLKWVGDDGSPKGRAAAYVIVAYYFDSCDIFENSSVVLT